LQGSRKRDVRQSKTFVGSDRVAERLVNFQGGREQRVDTEHISVASGARACAQPVAIPIFNNAHTISH
jgi:hypothetical protein